MFRPGKALHPAASNILGAGGVVSLLALVAAATISLCWTLALLASDYARTVLFEAFPAAR